MHRAHGWSTQRRQRDGMTVQIGSCGGKITIRQVGNVSLPSAITSILWNRRVVPNYLANYLANGARGTEITLKACEKCIRLITYTHANVLTDQLVSVNFSERILKGDTSQTVYRTVELVSRDTRSLHFWKVSIDSTIRLSGFHPDVMSPI